MVHTLVSGGRDAHALTQEDTDYSVAKMTPGESTCVNTFLNRHPRQRLARLLSTHRPPRQTCMLLDPRRVLHLREHPGTGPQGPGSPALEGMLG